MLRASLPLKFLPFNAHLGFFGAGKTQQQHRCCLAISRRGHTGDVTLNRITGGAHNSTVTRRRYLNTKWPSVDGNGADELEGIGDGKGKLAPTSSHLFKLILPLSRPGLRPPPTVFLLHPSQPLSHATQLILKSLAPATPEISFRNISHDGKPFQWCGSTEVGDFVRDSAKAAEFQIVLTHNKLLAEKVGESENEVKDEEVKETVLRVKVPTFTDRTRFLRRRLGIVERRLEEMRVIKNRCDQEANRGVRRLAVGGLGMLIVYWAAVCRLTFWEFGWDIMEPITYLSGLTMVILGYLWFLYQGREVSYTSVLNRSISKRREVLYRTRGLDIELWTELIAERKSLYKEIERISEDYNENQDRKPKRDKVEEEDTKETLEKDD